MSPHQIDQVAPIEGDHVHNPKTQDGGELIPIDRWAELLGISDKAVLTTHEAADVLRISERSVRQHIYDGTIPCVRLGRRVLLPVPALLRYLLADERQRNDS